MKKLLIITVFLSGCSLIMPVAHDPAAAKALIDVKYKVETLSCENKVQQDWDITIKKAHYLKLYTEFREDPQAENADEIEKALDKANKGQAAFCNAKLNLTKTRIQVIEKAWKGRD
jgi:hypothetical protein